MFEFVSPMAFYGLLQKLTTGIVFPTIIFGFRVFANKVYLDAAGLAKIYCNVTFAF